MNPSVLILDNGAHSIKAGFSASNPDEARIIPNAIVRSKGDRRMYVGPEIDDCRDHFALHYRLAFEKGFLTDWDTEKAVWDRAFDQNVLGADPTQLSLLVTEPYFNLPKIQETYDQLVFEEYEFQSYYRAAPAAFIPFANHDIHGASAASECIIVVDTGFSFTHIVPLLSGTIYWPGVKRIDVGGKLLSNHLKELISYRHYNMMDQTYIVNEIKEQCCYISRSFAVDLDKCRDKPRRNSIVQEYVLPDFSANKRGFIRQPREDRAVAAQQDGSADGSVLYMENERFSVPELLFNPSQIGLDQAGLPETIARSISLLPSEVRDAFWANIHVVGGNALFDGFTQRLFDELRTLAPADCEVVIHKSSKPLLQAYRGAWSLAQTASYHELAVRRAEYLEHGSRVARKMFQGLSGPQENNHSIDSEEPGPPLPAARRARSSRT